MRRAPLLSALFLGACMGPNDETRVVELRVMAMVAEPPEVAPGAMTTLTVHVADPLDEAPEVLFWTCADLGDGCLEASEPGLGATVAAPVDNRISTTRMAPPPFAGIVGDGTTVIPVPSYALACAPDLCPPLDDAKAAPEPGTAAADELSAFLEDPFTGLKDLPLAGTSLAFSLLSVSTRAAPVVNPVVTAASEDPVTVAPGGSVELTFNVTSDDVTTAYGYTTAGGFDATEYAVEDGAVTLTWFGSEEAADATIWVVVNGEEGGSAVWTAAAKVE